jgi:anaerobic magnesium-protoporphyrin IX monomethyl ester cyclase
MKLYHSYGETNRRILLIEPPFYRLFKETYALVRYPLSLGYLAASVKTKTDWDVMTYNADFAAASDPFEVTYFKGEGFLRYRSIIFDSIHRIWQEVRSVISEYAPAVVGISAKSSTFASAIRAAGIAKEINPEIIVVVGGPHPSAMFSKIPDPAGEKDSSAGITYDNTGISNHDIDIFVVGEGEETIVELLQTLEKGKDWADICGIIFRKKQGFIMTPPRRLAENLDLFPFPHQYVRDVLKDFESYPLTAFGNIFATRGCSYQCLFCGSRSIWGRGVRFRSPQNVAEEILKLRDVGVNDIHFDDDTFGVTGRYIEALCSVIKSSCPGIRWSCEIHVRLVNDKNISLMKEAGCNLIQLGIESGNNGILKEIRKGFTVEEALAACKLIKAYDIKLETFFMAGFPQETEASLNDTAEVIEEIECDKIIYSIFTPYPGTEAFELCRNKGMIPCSYDPSLYHHQSPENCFCINIPPERFKEMSSHIEEFVVEKNRSKKALLSIEQMYEV